MNALQKSKAKVCHITTVHQPFDGRIFFRECRALYLAGFDVTLIAQHHSDETVEDIRIVTLGKSRNRLHRISVLMIKALGLAIKQRADIYHFHDPELIVMGLLLKLLTRKPVIYDCHEYYADAIASSKRLNKILKMILRSGIRIFEKNLYHLFDLVIGVIDDQHSDFPRAKFMAIHNFAQRVYFQKTGAVEKEYDLIYAGTISESRGLYTMLELVKLLKDDEKLKTVKLAILGYFFDSSEKQRFDHYIKDNGLLENVIYLGAKPHNDVVSYLRKAKIGLFLPFKTAQYDKRPQIATKMFEYMGARIPIISTDFKHTIKFMGNVKYMKYVKESDIIMCGRIVKELLANSELREELGSQAYDDFMNKYTWETEAVRLLKAYDDLLKA